MKVTEFVKGRMVATLHTTAPLEVLDERTVGRRTIWVCRWYLSDGTECVDTFAPSRLRPWSGLILIERRKSDGRRP